MDRNARTRFRPALDALDARRLMAANLTASLSRGVLTVTGTDAADVIAITIQGPSRSNRAGLITVDGAPQVFTARQVRRIDVNGGAGDDAIAVQRVGRAATRVRIDGGAGNDFINGVWDSPPAPVAPPIATSPLAAIEQRIVDLTNAARQAAGLAPLAVSGLLVQAARIESGNMARLGIMSHDLPGTAQPGLADRAAAVGYRYSLLGENIAYNYPDADAVVAGWMASPGHRANILNPSFTEIGVSVAYGGQGSPYYTQVFGHPA